MVHVNAFNRPTLSDHGYLSRAIALSRKALKRKQYPIAALIVAADGLVLAEAINEESRTGVPLDHAEMVAIRHACRRYGARRLEGATIYTTCEPCPMCLGAIYWSRLARIVFANAIEDTGAAGFADGMLYDELTKPRHQRMIPSTQLLKDQALPVLHVWAMTAAR